MLLLEEQRNQAERDSGTLVADAIADRMRRLAELDGLGRLAPLMARDDVEDIHFAELSAADVVHLRPIEEGDRA